MTPVFMDVTVRKHPCVVLNKFYILNNHEPQYLSKVTGYVVDCCLILCRKVWLLLFAPVSGITVVPSSGFDVSASSDGDVWKM